MSASVRDIARAMHSIPKAQTNADSTQTNADKVVRKAPMYKHIHDHM